MRLSTENLVLSADATIDLQLHTHQSDGKWTAESLIDHLKAEGFGLAAITDHDRADLAAEHQRIALENGFPLLVAVEVSSMWQGNLVDFLCYGFDPDDNALLALSRDVAQRQADNTTLIFQNLRQSGYAVTDAQLQAILAKPSSQHLPELIAIAEKYRKQDEPIGNMLIGAGFGYQIVEPAKVVEAAHESGAVCILAHPGRDDGFTCFDARLLDALREEAPIDGIEAYYPLHSDEQTQLYLEYAAMHDLYISAGSDSHSSERPPIQYPAEQCRALLQHLRIEVR